jgi:DNA polymerase-1
MGNRLGWVHRRGVEDIMFMPSNTSKEAERVRKHWRNVCLNTPIQNVANCFSLASMTEAVRWTEEQCPEAQVVMTVHDEILLEVPEHMVLDVARHVARIMLSWPSGVVPLAVDAEVGDDWGNMKKLELEA